MGMESKDQQSAPPEPAGESEIRTEPGGERRTPPGERFTEEFGLLRDQFIVSTWPIAMRFRR